MRFEVILGSHASRKPLHPAIITEDQSLSYQALYDSASRVASSLVEFGVKPGDRVAIYVPNSLAYLQAFFGVLLAGGVVVPVSTWLSQKEMLFCYQDSGAKVLFLGEEQARAIGPIWDEVTGMIVNVGTTRYPNANLLFSEMLSHPISELPDISAAQEDCLLLYTSGTTGRPKGAVQTHANVLVTGLVNGLDWKISPADRFLVATPLANRTGIARIINSVVLGGTLCVMSAFDPEKWISFVEKEKVTVAGSVPTMWRRLLPLLERSKGRCSSLRTVLVTGEAFPVELNQRVRLALPQIRIVSFFGMTETGAVTSLEGEEQITHPKSVGRAVPGVELKIVDQNSKQLATGDVGELLIRTGQPGSMLVMKGYFNRPEANRESLRDGWFYSGDLCYRDAAGYIYIVDRKKDMIVSGGLNIYSKELENVLNQFEPVADCAAIGVEDVDFGEAVAIFVELKPNCETSSQDIIEYCRENMASYKKPKHVFFIDSLPRNSIGKILKRELVERANGQLRKN